ncbi:hypothetical protein Pelo_12264 [Pelomyxa schiedti]|nr:hypothetical protein Pelo_12264 [Pelomyxa schiedti]
MITFWVLSTKKKDMPFGRTLVYVVGLFLAVEGSVLIGDNYWLGNITIYTMDTEADPLEPTDIYFMSDGSYLGGCIDNSDNIVYLVYGYNGEPHRIDALDPTTGTLIYTGAEFTVDEYIGDVKCDSVWHTVILITTIHRSVIVYNAVPATGELTVTGYYNSSSEKMVLTYGGQAYDSQTHQYFFPNLNNEIALPDGYIYMGLMLVFHEDGTIEEYPWETKFWCLENPSALPGGESLLGVNMSFPSSGSILNGRKQRKSVGISAGLSLDVMDVGSPITFSDVGPTYSLTNGVWAIGSTYIPQTNQFYMYEAPEHGAQLLTWDVETGIRKESGELKMEPLNWLGYLYS